MNNTNNNITDLTNIADISGSCFNYVKVFSEGLWNVSPQTTSILQHHLVRFHLQLIAIIFISTLLHFFFRRLYLPRFSAEIVTGMILGITFLDKTFNNVSRVLFPPIPDIVIAGLAKLGFTLFTFTAGVRMDPSLVARTGKNAWILGLVMLIVPFGMMHTIDVKLEPDPLLSDTNARARITFVSVFFSVITTSQFVGVTELLMHLKITNSRLGHLALASTLVNEMCRFGYSTFLGYMNAIFNVSTRVGLQTIIFSVIFILMILFALKPISHWLIRITPEDKPMKEIYSTLVVAVVLILASLCDSMGLYYAFAPFLFGLIVPAGSPLAETLLKKLDTFVFGFLVPLLSTYCAMKFDLWSFFNSFGTGDILFKITLIGFIIKLIGTFIAGIMCKLQPKDAAAFTFIVNAKGVLEIGVVFSFSNMETQNLETNSGIFLVFLLASFVTPLVKILYDPAKQYIGYKKKSIEHAPDDAELQIVACAYKQEDAMAAIKLLEYSNPTKQSPISIYGLCLEELVSSATPIWIDHQLGQKTSSAQGSRSQPLIDVFKYFKSQHKKLIQVHVFTAISPLKQMHEDICWLSFEKAASIVIVPFHKKWNNKGKLVSTNADIRAMNINVLNRAPCSVGILIDRPKDRGLSSVFVTSSVYRVCVVFVGGPDDREALAYALRMAGSSRVQLTVMHFTVSEDCPRDNWETMLDSEVLRSMRDIMAIKNVNINYIEESVRDGCDTAAILRSAQDRYDLIMVGRRHENNPTAVSGLSDWVELPELGPLGDLLASADITCPLSVLVVQQQIMKASHSSILN